MPTATVAGKRSLRTGGLGGCRERRREREIKNEENSSRNEGDRVRSVYKQEDGAARVREGKQNKDGYLLEREKE